MAKALNPGVAGAKPSKLIYAILELTNGGESLFSYS
jgi:hypothetical protein